MTEPNAEIGPAAHRPSEEASTEVVRRPVAPTVLNAGACLVQIYPSGHGMGSRFSVGLEPVLVGRDAKCQICIDDDAVSRFHAHLVQKGSDFYLTDYRSTNGTFVNDRAIFMHKLQDGDYVRVGRHIFRFLGGNNLEALYHEELARLAMTDALTGIANQRALTEFLERQLVLAIRHGRPLALIMIDVDHFKAINDRLGHLAGDLILRDVAVRLSGELTSEQFLARYGGEEFAVVLPVTRAEPARECAERLRCRIEASPFSARRDSVAVTLSLGVATTTGNRNQTIGDFIGRADHCLYQAKTGGRNRVVVDDTPDSPAAGDPSSPSSRAPE